MAKQSFFKRILSLGRVEESAGEPAAATAGPEPAGAAAIAGDAALRPSIAEILFRRRLPDEDPGAPETAEAEPATTGALDRAGDRRANRKEETAQKISEGFDNLSGLLRSINEKLETGNDRNRVLADSIDGLPEVLRSIPETNRAQIEFLGTISKQLDVQNKRAGEAIENFRTLPEILRSIPESQRQHAERLHEIAALLTENSARQIEFMRSSQDGQQAALASFQEAQQRSLNVFHKAQQQSLSVLRGAQKEQTEQVKEFLSVTQKTMNRMLLVCSVLVGGAILVAAAMLLLR